MSHVSHKPFAPRLCRQPATGSSGFVEVIHRFPVSSLRLSARARGSLNGWSQVHCGVSSMRPSLPAVVRMTPVRTLILGQRRQRGRRIRAGAQVVVAITVHWSRLVERLTVLDVAERYPQAVQRHAVASVGKFDRGRSTFGGNHVPQFRNSTGLVIRIMTVHVVLLAGQHVPSPSRSRSCHAVRLSVCSSRLAQVRLRYALPPSTKVWPAVDRQCHPEKYRAAAVGKADLEAAARRYGFVGVLFGIAGIEAVGASANRQSVVGRGGRGLLRLVGVRTKRLRRLSRRKGRRTTGPEAQIGSRTVSLRTQRF